MSLSPQAELERWGATADRQAIQRVLEIESSATPREKFISAVLTLANTTGPFFDAPSYVDNDFESIIRSGTYPLGELTLQASAYYYDGVPPRWANEDSLGDSLVYINDLVDLPEETEYPIAFELQMFHTRSLDQAYPEVVDLVYTTDADDSVYFDFGDGEEELTTENSTQRERDTKFRFFFTRYKIQRIINQLPPHQRGLQDVMAPNLAMKLADVSRDDHARLF